MSVAAATLRCAINTSRCCPHDHNLTAIFLPFLYQTKTILGSPAPCRKYSIKAPKHTPHTQTLRYSVNRTARRWYETDHRYRGSEVPFDGEDELLQRPAEGTSITAKERKAFEALLEETSTTRTRKQLGLADLEQATKNAIAMRKAQVKQFPVVPEQKAPWPKYLTALEQKVQVQQQLEQRKAPEEKAAVVKQRDAVFDRIYQKFAVAKTDSELWKILQEEVFNAFHKTPRKEKEGGRAEETAESQDATETTEEDLTGAPSQEIMSLAAMGPTYPALVAAAMRQFCDHFPASCLGLAILPTLRKLGREHFLLGVSTSLYNETLLTKWQKCADLKGIDELLSEMGNGAVDYDQATLDIVEAIRYECTAVQRGDSGSFKQAIWNMETFRRESARLDDWAITLKKQLESDAIRNASK